jgi:putative Ca2+/H+ antiporter (TMEM165/GDT1 family)
MFESVLIPFFTILAAEFLDKSQLTILLLAAKVKSHAKLLLGVFLAFLVVDGLAVFLGSYLTDLFPIFWVKILSGILFIIFGIKSLLEKESEKVTLGKINNTFLASFSLLFLSEWGDKTQIAAAIFAARFEPLPVLIGVMLALMLLATATVFFSKVLSSRVKPGVITKAAGV